MDSTPTTAGGNSSMPESTEAVSAILDTGQVSSVPVRAKLKVSARVVIAGKPPGNVQKMLLAEDVWATKSLEALMHETARRSQQNLPMPLPGGTRVRVACIQKTAGGGSAGSKRTLTEEETGCDDYLEEGLAESIADLGTSDFKFNVELPLPKVLPSDTVNAIDRIMGNQRSARHLPPRCAKLVQNGEDKLHDKLLGYFEENRIGWTLDELGSVGDKALGYLVKGFFQVSKATWRQLNDSKNAGYHPPAAYLHDFTGCAACDSNPKTHHTVDKSDRSVAHESLSQFTQSCVKWTNKNWKPFVQDVQHLVSLLNAYDDRLAAVNCSQKSINNCAENARSAEDAVQTDIYEPLPPRERRLQKSKAQVPSTVQRRQILATLDKVLQAAEDYEAVDLADYVGDLSTRLRSKFLTDLKADRLSVPFQLFAWQPGGSRAGCAQTTVWKVPRAASARDEKRAYLLQREAEDRNIKYKSRRAKQEYFTTVVKPNFASSKAAAAAMYEYITGHVLPRDRSKADSMAVQAALLALETGDYDIAEDMRTLNSRPNNQQGFQPFFDELAAFVKQHERVDDRRQGATLPPTLPFPLMSHWMLVY